MKSFTFHTPTKIKFGSGCIDKLSTELEKYGPKKHLIITDKGIEETGILEKVEKTLSRKNIEFEVFSEIEPNPKDENIAKGVDFAKNKNIGSITGIGGGSSLDSAKLISMLLENEGEIYDYIGVDKVKKESLPLITVPTTAGTGSEVTFSAVFTDTSGEIHAKESVRSHLICPNLAIVDPELTSSMPPNLTAATGFDALTHAIEAYTANTAQPISDLLSLKAIEMIFNNIESAVKEGERIESREAMSLGSLMAGIAFFNSDVTAVHCLSEALGGFYDMPHGVANAVLLPYVMEYNLPAKPKKFANIAEKMGNKDGSMENKEKAKESIKAVEKLSKKVNLPEFRSLNVRREDLEEISKIASENVSVESNPREVKAEDFEEILEKAYMKE